MLPGRFGAVLATLLVTVLAGIVSGVSSATSAPPRRASFGLDRTQTESEETCEDDNSATAVSSVVESTAAVPLSQSADIDPEIDLPLTKDIELLSSILAEVVRNDNPLVYELYTQLRKHGMDRAADPLNTKAFESMKKLAYDLSPEDTLGVMRIFSVALSLVNAAEVNHRLRVTKEMEDEEEQLGGPLPLMEDSVRGTIKSILANNPNITPSDIMDKLKSQKVEIVLTAHPTEVNRKTLLRKYRRITETLATLDQSDLQPYQRSELITDLKQLVAAIWGSDEIRRKKPTPQQEAAGGNALIESVLWDAVPRYLRKLDAQCKISLGEGLPLDAVPIRFGSWIGGDRDGNPNVTPEVTSEVVFHQRLRAAKLLLRDMNKMYSDLAISSRFSESLSKLVATLPPRQHHTKEKYRAITSFLQKRLVKTIKECETQIQRLADEDPNSLDVVSQMGSARHNDGTLANPADEKAVTPIRTSSDLLEPLMTMYDSLVETGFKLVADGLLADTIRRLHVFGITLVPLDIREESTKHSEAMDAITRYLGVGSYREWDETARLNFLQAELSSKRPMFRTRDLDLLGFDDSVLKTLRTFQTASTLGPETLGAYVISQAQTASDVLAVMLLQKQFGMTAENGRMMRVVPLFETLDDLTNAPQRLETLFGISSYVGAVKGKQEVMVGYSDSAKDAGRLAACWAQYTSQERMGKVGKKHNIELTFFHGKGGTVGRGGNPALYRAILSHPPNTINGRFRVTEQGEMITQNFGSPDIAERSLDIYTAAVLREGFTKHVEPTDKWRNQMDRVSKESCAGYRSMVREEPRFVPYFRQATPELELGSLNIGSRPAKRNPKGGIESLRAIPWTFAWTQTRTHLSAWLGVAEGLNAESEQDREELKEMYQNWPWFKETIDLISMILSKTDFSISKNYDDILVAPEIASLGVEIRDKLVETRKAILDVSGSTDYAGPHVQLLRASTKIRNPFVDSINCVQAELLKELRNMPADDDVTMTKDVRDIKNIRKDALIVSINAIAQGMRNSG